VDFVCKQYGQDLYSLHNWSKTFKLLDLGRLTQKLETEFG